MSEQQILYEERHKKEIEELRNTVKQLMKHLNALINYLNNNKKLYNVLRRFINMNRSLKQIFFNEKGDGIIDPITEETIMEKIKKKELFIMHGLSANISKYDFSVKHDLQQLSEQLQEFILDKKIDSYQRMQ